MKFKNGQKNGPNKKCKTYKESPIDYTRGFFFIYTKLIFKILLTKDNECVIINLKLVTKSNQLI